MPHVQNRIANLMTKPLSLPSILRNRALRFSSAFSRFPNNPNFPNEYPGDGYVFFMDPFYAVDSRHPRYIGMKVFSFYNYLYSYRNLVTPPLFKHLSGMSSQALVHVLYDYRSIVFRDISFFNKLNTLCKTKPSQEEFEMVLLNRLLGHSQKTAISQAVVSGEINVAHIMILLEAYTIEAVRRILFGPNATYRRIMDSVNLVTETQSMIDGHLPQKFTSPSALQIFHDAEAIRLLGIVREKERNLTRKYFWHSELVNLVDLVSEGKWHVPVWPDELISRGTIHRNCIGTYVGRHFQKLTWIEIGKFAHKLLIVMSAEAEAELHLFFEKQDIVDGSTGQGETVFVCTRAQIKQCKTKYNNDYPPIVPERLCAVFVGLKAELFVPS